MLRTFHRIRLSIDFYLGRKRFPQVRGSATNDTRIFAVDILRFVCVHVHALCVNACLHPVYAISCGAGCEGTLRSGPGAARAGANESTCAEGGGPGSAPAGAGAPRRHGRCRSRVSTCTNKRVCLCVQMGTRTRLRSCVSCCWGCHSRAFVCGGKLRMHMRMHMRMHTCSLGSQSQVSRIDRVDSRAMSGESRVDQQARVTVPCLSQHST